MYKPRLMSFLAFALLLPAALPLAAQAPPQIPDSIQAMLAEFSEKNERLTALQDRVLSATPELQERQGTIQVMVERAIREEDPAFDAYLERMDALEGIAMAAQESEDMEALMAAIEEAQGLEELIEDAHLRALERDSVQEAIDGFQSDLLDAMRELDPGVDEVLERLQELAATLSAAAGAR